MCAQMVELVDTLVSGARVCKDVRVQVSLWANGGRLPRGNHKAGKGSLRAARGFSEQAEGVLGQEEGVLEQARGAVGQEEGSLR